MTRTPIALAAGIAALVLTGACGTGSGPDRSSAAADVPATGSAARSPAPAGDTVILKLIAFAPSQIDVPSGTTVTWRQDDVASHTVTSGGVDRAGGTVTARPDGRFDSGTISKGQNFRFTFSEPGAYPFFCAVHPATMTGVVTVK